MSRWPYNAAMPHSSSQHRIDGAATEATGATMRRRGTSTTSRRCRLRGRLRLIPWRPCALVQYRRLSLVDVSLVSDQHTTLQCSIPKSLFLIFRRSAPLRTHYGLLRKGSRNASSCSRMRPSVFKYIHHVAVRPRADPFHDLLQPTINTCMAPSFAFT